MKKASYPALISVCLLLLVLLSLGQWEVPRSASHYILLSQQFASPPHADDGLPDLNCTQLVLDNGLRVVLREEHAVPLVAVDIRYHAGAKDETAGHTGLAHLLEHMMFQATSHYSWNGSPHGATTADSTHYASVGLPDSLDFVLHVEAHRMAYLPQLFSQDRFNHQRDVVLNEKRQGEDTKPYGSIPAKIAELTYPPTHPYHWPVIGSAADIAATSLRDVKAFAWRYYGPNNASLAVIGDFHTQDVIPIILKYFGPIANGPPLFRPRLPVPRLARPLAATVEQPVALPRLYLVWNTVPEHDRDEAALDLLSFILAHSEADRLARVMVYQRQLAQDVQAFHPTREWSGQFWIVATARPGAAGDSAASLTRIEAAIEDELAKIKAAPPSPTELARAQNEMEARQIADLETVHKRGDELNRYSLLMQDTSWLRARLLAYRRVTAADVQRVARTYLTANCLSLKVVPGKMASAKGLARSVLSPAQQQVPQRPVPSATLPPAQPLSRTAVNHAPVTTAHPTPVDVRARPHGAPDLGVQAHSATRPAARRTTPDPTLDRYLCPGAQFRLPPLEPYRLANGLRLIVVQRHNLPLVSVSLALGSGSNDDPPGQDGLASLTLSLLERGTTTRSSPQLDEALGRIGARYDASVGEDTTLLRVDALSRHLGPALDVLSDIIQHPALTPREWQRVRRLRQDWFAARRTTPRQLASFLLAKLVSSRRDSVGHSLYGDTNSLNHIALSDISKFYRAHYRPQNAVLVVAGDVHLATLLPALRRTLVHWQGLSNTTRVTPRGFASTSNLRLPQSLRRTASPPVAPVGPPPPVTAPQQRIYLVDRPGATQSYIAMAQASVALNDHRQLPTAILSRVLGHGLGSRLESDLREERGYTYSISTDDFFGRQGGRWEVGGAVQTAATAPALEAMLRDLEAVRTTSPVTLWELRAQQWSLLQGFPQTMETVDDLASHVADQVLYHLPTDYYSNYMDRVRAVSLEEVQQVAAQWLCPAHLPIVIIGDRKAIEPALRALPGIGPTVILWQG
ncbi:MAG: insulinase family protein [Abitibacteriaceae bacterium]|nr:insulinase family protein [Abditibacteriaceae bacterium]